jgi:acid phosphatase (class A)
MSFVNSIQKTLSDKLSEIDGLKYYTDLEYEKSHYANMTFPELGNINLFSIVDRPPKNSSPHTKKELEYIARQANNRSIEQIKFVYEIDENPLILFEKRVPYFPYHKLNTIYMNIVTSLIDHLKWYYNRARPFQVAQYYNINIDILETRTHHTPSYPSGHTMYAALAGEILKSIYPDKRAIFDELITKVGHARVLQGVHYPTDNIASIQIIKTIYPKLSEYYEKL